MKLAPRNSKRSRLRVKKIGTLHAGVAAAMAAFLRRRKASGYMVGGYLRDLLTGRSSKDMDLVVGGVSPAELARHLHRELGFSTPVIFPRFKTALTVGRDLEIEICSLDGSLGEDARRRDFTVNCLYADLANLAGRFGRGAILDPTGRGFRDLRDGVLRTPVEPAVTFWLDPLRILRAVRFYATHGLRLEPDLVEAMPRVVYLLGTIAGERVRGELEQIVTSSRLVSSFNLMHATGVLATVLPELERAVGFSQDTPYHSYDLFIHTLKTAGSTRPVLKLRLAALLHDLGKVETRTVREGRSVYYGHDEVSARIAKTVLRRLKFPRKMVTEVTFLVGNHMINYSAKWSDRAVRRLMRKMGARLDDVLEIVEADRKAQHPHPGHADNIKELRRRIAGLQEGGGAGLRLPVTGHDIMRILGLEEGPLVGRAKEFLLDEALKSRSGLTRADCVRLLERWRRSVRRTA